MVWPVVEEKNMAVVRLYTDPVQFAVRWEERPQKTDCYASYCPPLVDLGWDKEYEGFWVWQVPKPEHVSDVRLALEESGYVYKLRDMINAS